MILLKLKEDIRDKGAEATPVSAHFYISASF